MIDAVSGVRKRGTSFQVRWVEDGRSRSFDSASREAVEAKRQQLLATVTASAPLDLPDIGSLSSLGEWQAALQAAARAAHAALVSRDSAALNLIRRYQAILTDLSSSWHRNSSSEALEAELAKLVAFVDDIYSGRVDGPPAAITTARRMLDGRTRPG